MKRDRATRDSATRDSATRDSATRERATRDGARWPRWLAAASILTLAALAAVQCRDGSRNPARSGPQRVAVGPTRGYILISIDTLRADHLGSYGYRRDTSPFFDALARSGLLFENAIAQLPGTLPSHMSMLTGLYPEEHGVFPPLGGLSPSIETLPERLARAGFKTAGHSEGGYVAGAHGFARGFAEWTDNGGGETSVERTFSRGAEFLGRVGDAPFFLFLHTYAVHTPYTPPAEYRARFWQQPDLPIEPTDAIVVAANRGQVSVSPQEVEYLRALYDGSIRYVDHVIEGFFSQLDRLGLRDQTTIIVTADHGEEFMEHGKLAHEQIYRETLRVPLLILHPRLTAGRRVRTPVELIDLGPTILDLAGLGFDQPVSGRSLVPWLDSSVADDAAGEGYSVHFSRQMRSLYRLDESGLHHLLVDHRVDPPRIQLFDLARDPSEQHDRALELPTRTRELSELLDRLRFAPVAPAIRVDLTAQREARLRALGYLK